MGTIANYTLCILHDIQYQYHVLYDCFTRLGKGRLRFVPGGIQTKSVAYR